MKVRALDLNGDFTFGKGQNDYKTQINAIAQNIQTRLFSFLGDCFFATADGLDWLNLLGSKNQIAINLAVSGSILNTPNVTGLKQLRAELNHATRNIQIEYKVQTTFGETSDLLQFNLI